MKKILSLFSLALILSSNAFPDVVDVGGFGDPAYKKAVADVASLPPLGNSIGDMRVSLDTVDIYIWDGAAWQLKSGSGGGGGVTSFNARVGAVTPQVGDYSAFYDATGAAAAAQAFSIQRANHTGTQLASTISNFTTAAQSAVVTQTITNGVTATAPSEDAVFDALALKANANNSVLTGISTINEILMPQTVSPALSIRMNDTDTGMGSDGDGIIYWSTNGVERLRLTASSFSSTLPISAPGFVFPAQADNLFFAGPSSGGPSTPSFRTIASGDIPNSALPWALKAPITILANPPSYGFAGGDDDTGMFSTGDGNVSIQANGNLKASFDQNTIDLYAVSGTTVHNDLTVTGNIVANNFPPIGANNSFAGYNNSGSLTSNFGWYYDDISHGVRMTSQYDPVLGNATTNDFNVEFNPSANNGNSMLGANFINRYDSTGNNFDSDRFDGISTFQSHVNGTGHLNGMRSFFTNQQAGDGSVSGSVDQLTNVDLASSIGAGFTVNNFLGQSIRLNQEGVISNDILMLDISTGGPGSPVAGSNVRGVNVNLQTESVNDLTAYTASNSKTVGANSQGFTYFDSGNSGGFIGMTIQKNGNTTDAGRYSKGIQVQMDGDSAQDIYGQSISVTGAAANNAVGLQINMNGATSSSVPTAIDSQGGTVRLGFDAHTSVASLPPFSSLMNVGGQFNVDSGSPLLATPVFLNNFGWNFAFGDDVTADNFLGAGNSLGISIMAFVNQIAVDTSKTVDTLNYVFLGGSNVDAGTGHINEINVYRGIGLINAGGGVTADNQRVFYVDPGFDGSIGTNKWGFINASSTNNWMKGAMVLGGSTGLPTGAYELDVTGNSIMTGDLTVTGVAALGNGSTATTQSALDNSTKIATTAYVDSAISGISTDHLVLTGTAPTATPDANAGTGATCSVSANSTTGAGTITLVTGSAGWATGSQCAITFAAALGSAPKCVLMAGNANASAAFLNVYATKTTTDLTINFVNPDNQSNTLIWDYQCVESN